MNALTSELLPAGEDVPFTKIGDAMARGTCHVSGATPMRALVATVVAVGPSQRLAAAAEALQTLGDAGTVRGILISEGDNAAPPARVAGNTVALHGLKPSFFNNAVAALRLSSLPTLVWWRGGRADTLDGLADLADRIVLDYDRPATASPDDAADPIWSRAATLFDDCAFSDLRWARLTQWRALMAHFFDIPEVLAAAADFHGSESWGLTDTLRTFSQHGSDRPFSSATALRSTFPKALRGCPSARFGWATGEWSLPRSWWSVWPLTGPASRPRSPFVGTEARPGWCLSATSQ